MQRVPLNMRLHAARLSRLPGWHGGRRRRVATCVWLVVILWLVTACRPQATGTQEVADTRVSVRTGDVASETRPGHSTSRVVPEVAEGDVASAPTAPPGDLALREAIGLAQETAAWLVLLVVSGPESAHARAAGEKLAVGLQLSPLGEEFPLAAIAAVRARLEPFAQARPELRLRDVSVALGGLGGAVSPAELAAALLSARQARPDVALVGALIEVAHGIEVVRVGDGSTGSPAFGAGHVLVCPGAKWHDPEVLFALIASGSAGADLDVLGALQSCLTKCPAVQRAVDGVALRDGLVACDPALAQMSRGAEELLTTPLALVDAMALSELLGALGRAEGGAWLGPPGLATVVLREARVCIDAMTLVMGWGDGSDALPAYPFHASSRASVSYLLCVGEAAEFGAWPSASVRASQLASSTGPGQLAVVQLEQPATLQRQLRSGLRAQVGLVMSSATPVGLLREALRTTRAAGLDERFLAVRDHEHRRGWLALDAGPAVVADTLLQQTARGWVLWRAPGAVTTQALEEPPVGDDGVAAWPGEVVTLAAALPLRRAIPLMQQELARHELGTLLLDVDDAVSVGDLMALANIADLSRAPGTQTTALLSSPPTSTERRIDGLFVTEHRAPELVGAPEAPRIPQTAIRPSVLGRLVVLGGLITVEPGLVTEGAAAAPVESAIRELVAIHHLQLLDCLRGVAPGTERAYLVGLTPSGAPSLQRATADESMAAEAAARCVLSALEDVPFRPSSAPSSFRLVLRRAVQDTEQSP